MIPGGVWGRFWVHFGLQKGTKMTPSEPIWVCFGTLRASVRILRRCFSETSGNCQQLCQTILCIERLAFKGNRGSRAAFTINMFKKWTHPT